MNVRAAVLISALLLTACGSETSTDSGAPAAARPAPAAPRDVCGMLTMDELKTAAGLVEATGQSSKSGGADVCTWMGTGGKGVIVQVHSSANDYESGRKTYQEFYKTTAEEVPAIGEKAYYMYSKGAAMGTATLVTQKGSTPVSVQVLSATGDANTSKGEATAVAHVILGKL